MDHPFLYADPVNQTVQKLDIEHVKMNAKNKPPLIFL